MYGISSRQPSKSHPHTLDRSLILLSLFLFVVVVLQYIYFRSRDYDRNSFLKLETSLTSDVNHIVSAGSGVGIRTRTSHNLNSSGVGIGTRTIQKINYTPSALEQEWKSHVGDSSWIDRPCSHLQKEADQWLSATREGSRKKLLELYPRIFSSFQTSNDRVSFPIEPLAYILRNPTFPCGGYAKGSKPENDALMDKDYLVLASSDMFPKRRKSYFFDVGCSIYKGGWDGQPYLGQVGQLWWLVEDYNRNGIQFDHLWGWEAAPVDPTIFWKNMPQELKGRFTYWNFPASTERNDLTNPIEILKSECEVDDFCALKIDIDNGPVEWSWIQQILGDPEALAKVDELFFEHHVNNGVMSRFWRGRKKKNSFAPDETMALSYDIFSKLRAHGIRAHSWI